MPHTHVLILRLHSYIMILLIKLQSLIVYYIVRLISKVICISDADDREDCPTADEVATRCARSCIKKDDDGCLECMENCSGKTI